MVNDVSAILILEDESAIRNMLRVTLDSCGYETLEAGMAEEAYRCFEDADAGINLLISDLNLPGRVSGVRVALELRALLPSLRLILISGAPISAWGDQDAAELNEIPSDSVVFLQKPFDTTTFLNAVHRLIGIPMVAVASS